VPFSLNIIIPQMYFTCTVVQCHLKKDKIESEFSDQNFFKAPSPKEFKSRSQRFEDVPDILREGRLSPLDLMVELLDVSNLKYWAYRNELYKEENKKLRQILDLIFSSGLGKEKLKEWMLPHALEVICGKVSDEMDVVREAEKLPGLDAITGSSRQGIIMQSVFP
jgi:hypothetical protein